MNNAQLRDEAKFYFVPVLLGCNSTSRKLSRKIFRRYGILSYVLDEKRSLPDLLNISGKFLKLPPNEADEITVKRLKGIAESTQYTLPILIPCNEKYRLFAQRCKSTLELFFVLSDEQLALTDSPLKIIP